MLDRLTDRGRRVLVLARQEAQRLNSEFIRTEHILLGILMEEKSAAVLALKKLGVAATSLRAETERLLSVHVGSKTILILVSLSFSPRAKAVLDMAEGEAIRNGENRIGTEHLLCAILMAEDGIAWRAMVRCGIDIERLRAAIVAVKKDTDVSTPTSEDGNRKVMYVSCRNCGIVYRAEVAILEPAAFCEIPKKSSKETVRGRMCWICSCPDYHPVGAGIM